MSEEKASVYLRRQAHNLKQLTPRQAEVLQYLINEVVTTGIQPSVRDLMARFGWASANAVHEILLGVEHAGYIRLACHVARSISIIYCPDGTPFKLVLA